MIYIDRDKEKYDMRGKGADIITDIAFAVLKTAEEYAAISHKPLTRSIDIVMGLVRGGLRNSAKREKDGDGK